MTPRNETRRQQRKDGAKLKLELAESRCYKGWCSTAINRGRFSLGCKGCTPPQGEFCWLILTRDHRVPKEPKEVPTVRIGYGTANSNVGERRTDSGAIVTHRSDKRNTS